MHNGRRSTWLSSSNECTQDGLTNRASQRRAILLRRAKPEWPGVAALIVMPSNSPARARWPWAVLWVAGGLVPALLALRNIPPRQGGPVSEFEFVNRSAWVVTNLDLKFSLIAPERGEKLAQYCIQFTRHFTNVPPGGSVSVRSNTPLLMLVGLEASHKPYEPPAQFAAGFSGVTVASFYESPVVVATPGERAGLRFTGWNKFEDFHAR